MNTKHENTCALVGEISSEVKTNSGNKNGKDWNNANFSLLTEIAYNGGSAKNYHSISAFGKVADQLKGVSKGAIVKIIGSIGSYKDQYGNWKTQISASLIEVLSLPNAERNLGNRDTFLTDDLEDDGNNLPF